MNSFNEIKITDISMKPFKKLDKQWMLITAKKKDGSVNTMTASWGGFGTMWHRPVAYVVIRPQRFTKEFIDEAEEFSICFLPEANRKSSQYIGSVSGRDTKNKIANSGLTISEKDGIPYLNESETIMFLKVLSESIISESSIKKDDMISEFYPNKDFHHLYIAEITSAYEK